MAFLSGCLSFFFSIPALSFLCLLIQHIHTKLRRLREFSLYRKEQNPNLMAALDRNEQPKICKMLRVMVTVLFDFEIF